MATNLNAEIAANVRRTLDSNGASIATLAAQTPIPERTLKRRLTGTSRWTTDELSWISDALHTTPLELLRSP